MAARKATIVADLGFGDAGKGTVVDFLARQEGTSAVVRFNGGGQAAHNVITPDGRHHTFAQFGSGTFTPGVRTHLSRFMLVDPEAMADEAAHLSSVGCGSVFARLSVDENAKIVTPFHKAGNRIREFARGTGRHGTCGMGIGETMADHIAHGERTIYVRDLRDPALLAAKLAAVQEAKRTEFGRMMADVLLMPDADAIGAEVAILENAAVPAEAAERMWRTGMRFLITDSSYLARLAAQGNLLFEGAQGVLLDEWYGFHPHTTWSTTTFENALTLLGEIGYEGDQIQKIGVIRSYSTRHGEGPFPTQDASLAARFPEPHNGDTGQQGRFRVGWLDLVLARYALAACGGVSSLAVTHLDRFDAAGSGRRVAVRYERLGKGIKNLPVPHLDRAGQEALTRLLGEVSPVYIDLPDGATSARYLSTIEQELCVPVSIESYGPTASDKRIRAPVSVAA